MSAGGQPGASMSAWMNRTSTLRAAAVLEQLLATPKKTIRLSAEQVILTRVAVALAPDFVLVHAWGSWWYRAGLAGADVAAIVDPVDFLRIHLR